MIKKKKKYFTNKLIILFNIFLIIVIGLIIYIFSVQKYTLLILPCLLLLVLIICLLIPGTEYVYFCENSYFYRKNIFCKEVEIEYKQINNIIIDFGTGLYSGMKPLSNPGSVVYFLRNKQLVNAAYIGTSLIKELILHFPKKQIKILVNINSKIWGFPKKYHELLYLFLSPKDKKAFNEKFGEEYVNNLNN